MCNAHSFSPSNMPSLPSVLATLLLLNLLRACVPVICSQLDRYNCAAYNETVVTINAFGCSELSCTLSSYLNWLSSGTSEVLKCVSTVYITPTVNDTTCPLRPAGEILVKGDIYPIRCVTNADCLLENGNTTECICGLDGYQYCQPPLGSEVFETLWNECDSDSERSVDGEVWTYYTTLQQLYVYQVSAPSCAQTILDELVLLAAYNSALSLVLPCLQLLFS